MIACVTVGTLVTEYAVMPSASLMIGLRDSSSGAVAWLTIPTGHLSLAISEWEGLPVTLLTDEEFQEDTVAYFHMCREVYREMHSWPVYAFGFLTIPFCSAWTLPCRLAQWISNQPKAAFPESMVEWSITSRATRLTQRRSQGGGAFSQCINLWSFTILGFRRMRHHQAMTPDNESDLSCMKIRAGRFFKSGRWIRVVAFF